MSKLNLANLAQDELTKEEARRARGGIGCLCRCSCHCSPTRDFYYMRDFMANAFEASFEESSPF